MHMEGGGGGLSCFFVTGRKQGFAEDEKHEMEAHVLCAMLWKSQ